jgi:lysophospholipase L1-like esterase
MTNCLFFGDSITYGEYDGILGGWVDNLKRYCHLKYYQDNAKEVNIFNLGIGGETTEGFLGRFEIESFSRQSPDENLIFIFYGANDLAIKSGEQVMPKEKYQDNLETAISKARNITGNIFLISILPVSDKVDGVTQASGKLRTNHAVKEYNEVSKSVAKNNGINYIDLFSAFYEHKEEYISKDGVHPNEKGYQMISEYIKPIIENYL